MAGERFGACLMPFLPRARKDEAFDALLEGVDVGLFADAGVDEVLAEDVEGIDFLPGFDFGFVAVGGGSAASQEYQMDQST